MEISGKVLREVEFRDRLRGYDTDEVDEFLEKVAVAIDELRAEMARLAERAARAEQAPPASAAPPPAPPPAASEYGLDDDAIRRTLVLAQRTADLAIAEAREEAARILAEARGEAETLVGQAEEHARRTRDDAEQDLHIRIAQLGAERDRLEGDVQSLARLVENERARLTEALSSALQLVGETLTVSEQVSERRGEPSADEGRSIAATELEAAPASSGPAPVAEPGASLPDVEAEIAEDAASAYGGGFPGPSTGKVRPLPPEGDEAPGEELWQRWAHGRDLNLVPEPPELPGPGGPPGPSGGDLSA